MIYPNKNNFCGGNFQDWLEINLTSQCNGRCSWCVEKRGYKPAEHADWYTIASMAIKSGKGHIILLGGEPTLYPDIARLIQELVKHDKKVYITTNGSMLYQGYIEKNLKNVSGVNISIHHYDLDKNKEITGINLTNLRGAIVKLQSMGASVRLNCNCIKGYIDNYTKMSDYVNWAESVGANKVRFAELKFDDGNFVDLAEIMGRAYGLNDDPLIKGCNHDAIINGMPVNFRQMCGLQTNKRPQHSNVKQAEKNVLYYDGKMYNGWQIAKKEVKEENSMSKKMTDRELAVLLGQVAAGSVSVGEAAIKISRAMESNKESNSDHEAGAGSCQY